MGMTGLGVVGEREEAKATITRATKEVVEGKLGGGGGEEGGGDLAM